MYSFKLKKNKLKILAIPVKGIDTITSLFLVKVGSRSENSKIWGLSHFLEHMMFKGTRKRPEAIDLLSEMEGFGGNFNAFTGKEHTGYYIKSSRLHLNKSLDILADVLCNSLFKKGEIEKERKVIIEEINMYEDRPQEQIDDLFESIVYKDLDLEKSVIGLKKTVSKFKRKDLKDYFNHYYVAKNSILCLAGNLPKKKDLVKIVEKYFSKYSYERLSQSAVNQKFIPHRVKKKNILIKYKKTDQAHLMIGFKTIGIDHKDRYKQAILADILGGGMSARINQEIREKRGWAYYTYTYPGMYTYAGSLVTVAGVNRNKILEALKIILKEYQKVKKVIISNKELRKSKEHIKGKTLIGLESSNSQALYYGKKLLLMNRQASVEEELKRIEKVTAKDIKSFAKKYLNKESLYLAVIGPYKKKTEKFKKTLLSF